MKRHRLFFDKEEKAVNAHVIVKRLNVLHVGNVTSCSLAGATHPYVVVFDTPEGIWETVSSIIIQTTDALASQFNEEIQ